MTNQDDYEFNVAFSFLKEDEVIAYNVNDLIQDTSKTFIYSKNQEGLVGFDGEEKFHEIFGKRSRLVVIFYRQNWGQTPWTRIEMTAIKNRSLEHGYGFTIFVPLDKSPMPVWLPKTIIWYNFERWGAEGLASVIESKLSEEGIELKKVESAIDYAKRRQREITNQEEILQYLESYQAYEDAHKEFQLLFEKVKKIQKELTEIKFNGGITEDINLISIRLDQYALTFIWSVSYSNSLRNSSLHAKISKRINDFVPREYSETKSKKYDYHLNNVRIKGWKERNRSNFYDTETLVDNWIKELLSKVSRT